jgi:hypothetical protein
MSDPSVALRDVSARDLIAYDLIRDWSEAVAVVQGVCQQLTACGSAKVPELDQIRLWSSGEIDVLPGPVPPGVPATRLGYALDALLQGTMPPPELRLLISQVTGTNPPCTTVGEFSDRLAYYERPGRGRTLQALYERSGQVTASATPSAVKVPTVPVPEPSTSQAAVRPNSQGSAVQSARTLLPITRVLLISAGAVVLLTVLLAAWRFTNAGRRGVARVSGGVSKAVDRTIDSGADVVDAGMSSAANLLRKAGLMDPKPQAAPPPQEDETKPNKGRPRSVKGAGGAGVEPAGANARTNAQSSSEAATAATERQPLTAPAPPESLADPSASSAPSAVDEARLYTPADPGIQPPQLLWPQLPSDPSPDTPGAPGVKYGLVDLVVNDKGTVDEVKFLTPPGEFRQRMLISALKAWRYRPATKDGRPVRFVQRVKLPL